MSTAASRGELPIARKTLTPDETLAEARYLLKQGFRSILLLTGEHERLTGVQFLEDRIRLLASEVPSLAVEVQVWSEEEYRRLAAAGCDAVVIYQETYHPETYSKVHIAGRKRHFEWRLLGPERAARAGMRRVGIGALLGLHEDWRYEALATAAHARFLMKRYWRTQVTVSVPRIRPSASGYQPKDQISDDELVQLVCALRLLLPDAGLVISAREAPALRDGLFRVGITHTSAGSHAGPVATTSPRRRRSSSRLLTCDRRVRWPRACVNSAASQYGETGGRCFQPPSSCSPGPRVLTRSLPPNHNPRSALGR